MHLHCTVRRIIVCLCGFARFSNTTATSARRHVTLLLGRIHCVMWRCRQAGRIVSCDVVGDRLTISEEGCEQILNHTSSAHVLAKLIASLGVDEAGTSSNQAHWVTGDQEARTWHTSDIFNHSTILPTLYVDYMWEFLLSSCTHGVSSVLTFTE